MEREARISESATAMERHGLVKINGFISIYERILAEAEACNDPRIDKPSGVKEQLEALRIARDKLAPSQVVGMKALRISAIRG